MDTTKKLIAHIDSDHEGRIEQDGWGITVRVDHAEDPEMIRELVRRYNAHDALVEALKEALSDLQPPDMGGLTGAEHDAGAAEGTILKIREALKAAQQ